MSRRTPESIPAHRKDAVSFSNEAKARERMLKEPFCGYCKKLLHRTRADAHSYIGLLMRTAPRKIFSYTLHPYRCPHRIKGWHVGRDLMTVALLKEAKKK